MADLIEPANVLMSAHVADGLAMKLAMKEVLSRLRKPSTPFRAEAIGPFARGFRGHVEWSCGKFTPKTRAVICGPSFGFKDRRSS